MEANPAGFWLKEGIVLKTKDGELFRLVTELGAGKYSEVWRAEHVTQSGTPSQVAVKVMAAGLTKEERQIFLNEVETLQTLRARERELVLKEGQDVIFNAEDSLIPSVIAVVDGGESAPTYFIETLAKGKPLDLILREDEFLPEPEALIIAEQLGRVFQVLHEGLQQSYLDFQPKNVFWDSQQKRILVVDWNLLSKPGSADVLADIETLGRLFYRLMVGRSPVSGQVDIPERYRRLSLGTQELLARLVNPTWLRRDFYSISILREEIKRLLKWWQVPLDQLLLEAAKKASVEGGRKTTEEAYKEAVRILGITRQRQADPAVIKTLEEYINDRRHEADPLKLVEKSYLSRDDQIARDQLEKAANQVFTTPTLLAVERWRLVLGATVANREQVVRIIQGLSKCADEVWANKTAYNDLQWNMIPINEPALLVLQVEQNAWEKLIEAARKENEGIASYTQAAKLYRGVVTAVKSNQVISPTYLEYLLRVWGGEEGLNRLAENLDRKGSAYESSQSQMKDLLDALEKFPYEALIGKINHLEALARLALQQAEKYYQRGDFNNAEQLLDQIMPEMPESLLAAWNNLYRKLSRSRYWEKRLERAEEIFSMLKELPVEKQEGTQWAQILDDIDEIAAEKEKAGSAVLKAWSLVRRILLSVSVSSVVKDKFSRLAGELAPTLQELERIKDYDNLLSSVQQQVQEEISLVFAAEERKRRVKALFEEISEKINDEGEILKSQGEIDLLQALQRILQSVEKEQSLLSQMEIKQLIDSHRSIARQAFSLGVILDMERAVRELDMALHLARQKPTMTTEIGMLEKDRSVYMNGYRQVKGFWEQANQAIDAGEWQRALANLESLQRNKINGYQSYGEIDERIIRVQFELLYRKFEMNADQCLRKPDRVERNRLYSQLSSDYEVLRKQAARCSEGTVSEKMHRAHARMQEIYETLR